MKPTPLVLARLIGLAGLIVSLAQLSIEFSTSLSAKQ
jgi:hypothetical protein